MKKFLSVPAYLWAVACFLIIPVTFIRNDALAGQMARLSFMKIHPRFSGGDINRSYLSNGLHVTVNDPVFNGLRQRGRQGFVQVRFAPILEMPDTIREAIDYDLDGHDDFKVTIVPKTGMTNLASQAAAVQEVTVSSPLKTDWVLRVSLHKKKAASLRRQPRL